jgi:hypothetical protein
MLVNHVWRRYGVNPGGVLNVVMPVVFDGYSAGPSTKDLTHDRSCARSMVEDAMFSLLLAWFALSTCSRRRMMFLVNPQNKERR